MPAARATDIVPAIRGGIDQTRAGKPGFLEFITSKELVNSRP